MIACRFCGTILPRGALFCGECGRSVSAPPPERGSARTAPSASDIPPMTDTQDAVNADSTSTVSEPPAPPVRALGPGAGSTARMEPLLPVPPAPPILPVPAVASPERLEDLEKTRVSTARTGDLWVLQFSTGESVVVTGTGLVGRNPAAEPGEYVDHLVTLFDAGRSVSKTHAEFGQEGGRFWVSDRYSTNGTVIRAPGEEPRRCAPGRRYLVSRGTRVDIGEQFFVVS